MLNYWGLELQPYQFWKGTQHNSTHNMHVHLKIKYCISTDDKSVTCTCLPLLTCTVGTIAIALTVNPEIKSAEEALAFASKVSTYFKKTILKDKKLNGYRCRKPICIPLSDALDKMAVSINFSHFLLNIFLYTYEKWSNSC